MSSDGRKQPEVETTFGVSGYLMESDVLLWDRVTQTLWSQIDGRALKGPLEGAKLQAVPAIHALWKDWRAMYPQSQVLKKGSGETRSAYERYNRSSELGIFGRRNPDSRLPGKTSVLTPRSPWRCGTLRRGRSGKSAMASRSAARWREGG